MREKNYSLNDVVENLLEEKKYNSLRDILNSLEPTDAAALFENLPHDKLTLLFRLLSKERAALTFVEMDSNDREVLIKGFSDSDIKAVLDELYVDDAVDIVEEMPANVVKRILRQATPEMRQSINEILNYPADSAGSIMTTELVSFKPFFTVAEAINVIRKSGVNKETVYTCYVTDEKKRLTGCISAKTLLISSENEKIENLMDTNVIFGNTLDDKEQIAQTIAKYSFLALPICDGEGRLVGIVTVDDALDVLQDEASEDISKIAAVTPADKSYLKLGVFDIYKARIPWLLILMISATFTSGIITSFENALQSMVILTAFIPMLMDTGGNAGGQASITIIRALSLGEIKYGDVFRIVWKEFRVSFLAGITLAATNFIKVLVIDRVSIPVALTVSITLIFAVVIAKLIGCTLPILAKRIGFDPAVMASPIITTIVDALALLIYFSIATIVLGL